MTNPTGRHRRTIMAWAIEQLQAGLLASALPARLMTEFGLTAAQARHLANAAHKQYQQETETTDHSK